MSNFLDTLLSVLLKDKRLVAQDGGLLRNMAYELGYKMDAGLLQLLHKNGETRKHFFTKVGDLFVFDKMKFCWVVNNREFLPDSYTRFSNRIGLIDHLDKPIAQTENVQLAWPFKDCILEGGQTKDEQKRTEIFWNELLAPDECDRLLYPKVLAHAKRYTPQGSQKATDFDHVRDNLLIKGNNLLALASLLPVYAGQVKLIYIDPPYNTGNDSFQYNDRFNHAAWLTFMKNRLSIARKLLADNGSIWIQADDNEVHYLKVLCDELFERENFVANVVWQHSIQPKGYTGIFSVHHNHLLCYKKSSKFSLGLLERTAEDNKSYSNPDNDPRGPWRSGDVRNSLYRPNLIYDVISPSGKVIKPCENGWRWSKETLKEKIATGEIIFSDDETRVIRKIYLDSLEGRAPETIWFGKDAGTTRDAASEQKGLSFSELFTTPKPERLLQRILQIGTNENDLVLDFFAGSGTTLAVAHKMGRRYIGIEQMDYIETYPVERLKKVIGTEKKAKGKLIEEIDFDKRGISESVSWQGGGSFVFCELAALNSDYIARIHKVKKDDHSALTALWEEIQKSGFISYMVDLETINDKAEGFESLSFTDKKKFLIDVLDKNLLYVNRCDIDDEEFGFDKSVKEFNRSFYKEGK